MATRSRAAAAVALAAAAAAMVWWLMGTSAWPGAGAGPAASADAQADAQDLSLSARDADADTLAHRRGSNADGSADPLLVTGLRDRMEALLFEAGDADDPATLKQRLAGLIGKHFPPALATRALALAERYVDYRVALGALRAPKDLTDPRALRDAMEARQKVRLQFFDDSEYDALFAREAELDRYTLARLEIARNPSLTPAQRADALQATDSELSKERLAERRATTEHMAVAQQTAAFNTQNADDYTRHAARSAQYGEPAARALAQLDREERLWQQRLDQYSQARAQQGEQSPALRQLRQQLFSPEEQQRIEAALALRRLNAGSSRGSGS